MIIGDSSALITLAMIDKLYLLEELYSTLYVPQAVYDEVTIIDRPQRDKLKAFLKDKIKVVNPTITKVGLGLGELEAITLYKELEADILLIDDNRAKNYAKVNGVNVIGSLGILIQAKKEGYIQKVKPLLEQISNSQIYIASSLIEKVLDICDE
jgi:predicted nucleic acid-binding protein